MFSLSQLSLIFSILYDPFILSFKLNYEHLCIYTNAVLFTYFFLYLIIKSSLMLLHIVLILGRGLYFTNFQNLFYFQCHYIDYNNYINLNKISYNLYAWSYFGFSEVFYFILLAFHKTWLVIFNFVYLFFSSS